MGSAPHSCSRCSTTAVDASAASFHPSNAAIATGERSTGRPSNSVTVPAYVCDRRMAHRAAPGVSVSKITLYHPGVSNGRRSWLVAFLAFFLVFGAWGVAAPFDGPADEVQHSIRAAGVGSFDPGQ